MENFVVAIDGPAGSGKSSISKAVAKSLGFVHIDTGAMYRAVTLEAINRGIDLANENEYDFLNEISVIYKDNIIYLNGVDVSKEIRKKDITNNVSTPSKIKAVRDKMVEFQRESAKLGKVLMDGRDIGTVVLPDANLKVFLTASPEVRAQRRAKEIIDAGGSVDINVILEEIKARDFKDSNREIAPLKQADDAILLDTSNLSFEEVIQEIINLINKRLCVMKNVNENFDMGSISLPKSLRVGDKLDGVVVSIADDNTIMLDIQNFTEGTMHLDHYTKDKSVTSFRNLVKVGDVIKCEVAKVTEEHIYLSRLNQITVENFQKLVAEFEAKNNVVVTVKSVVAGKGYVCEVLGNRVFMPIAQAPEGVKIGDKVEVRILRVDEKKRDAVVSRRVIDQEIYQDNKAKELESINVGDVLTGTVAKVEKFGAFIKFTYNQGLLKANQLAHTFVDVTQELTEGQEIEVKVVGKENGKIALSRKALLKTPFELFTEAHKVGQTVVGKVVNKLPFGLLLEIAPNIKGLLHASEYSHNPNDNFNNCVVIGDEVEVAILKIEAKGEKVSLSRKALMDNPWSRVKAQYGDLVDFKVVEINEKGLKVEALGVDGIVPTSDAVVELKNASLDSYYAVGDEGKAYITDIRPREWFLKLSIRKYLVEQERKSFEKYLEPTEESTVTLGEKYKDLLK
jgi:small subunit ribosomal protein S1